MMEEQDQQWLTVEQIGKPKSEGGRDITLLLLGETGVGKSTWINGFANFLEYDTLIEAEANPTLCVIPTSFTMTDDNYEERVISTGSDKNEVTEIGQSATQSPQSYTFPKDGNIIRLIDTPGIGDVRGVEQDKKNFEMILDHISHLDELHGICILLKPNNARLNIMFSFCIKELLTHLHKDACQNIVFCFTNSRSTFYRPGDTLPALRKLLDEHKDVKIPLGQSTLYCMDNESIRFLFALKDGINFTAEERKNYTASWDKSVGEVSRLLKHIIEQRPHSIQNTLSLNNARRTILALGSPIAEITRSIQINLVYGEKQREELITSKISKDELSKNLVIQQVDVRMQILEEPRTVCTAVKCTEFVQTPFETKTNYKTHCHANCSRGKGKIYKVANVVGHKNLKKCSAFDKKTGNCKHCGCSWKFHMKITYETFRESREFVDLQKQQEIFQKENAIKDIENFLEALDKHLEELRREQKEITKASLTFACFLKKNAITPYNDALDAYLTHFIREEQSKVAQGGDPKILEGMEKMRLNYKEQMEVLQNAMEVGGSAAGGVSAEDLVKCVENLYQLKHCGQSLKQMMNSSMNSASSNYTEKRIERNHSFTTTVTTTTKSEKKSGLFSDFKGFFRSPNSTGVKSSKASFKNRNNEARPTLPERPKPKVNPKLDDIQKQVAVSEKPGDPSKYKPPPPPTPVRPSKEFKSIQESMTPNNEPLTSVPKSTNSRALRPSVPPPPPIPVRPSKEFKSIHESMTPKNEPLTSASKPANLRASAPPVPPPPPPPPLIIPNSNVQEISVSDNSSKSALLGQIQQVQLKKTKDLIHSSGNQTDKKIPNTKDFGSGSSMNDMVDALKRALSNRAMRVQNSVDSTDDMDDDNATGNKDVESNWK